MRNETSVGRFPRKQEPRPPLLPSLCVDLQRGRHSCSKIENWGVAALQITVQGVIRDGMLLQSVRRCDRLISYCRHLAESAYIFITDQHVIN